MRILVDTDVLLDVGLARDPHLRSSGELLDYLQQRPGTGFIAWHTVSNFYYLTAGTRSGVQPRHFIAALTTFLEVAPSSTETLRFALNLPLSDFEDAMQVAAASACGADVIATRNIRDFAAASIPARRPSDLVRDLT